MKSIKNNIPKSDNLNSLPKFWESGKLWIRKKKIIYRKSLWKLVEEGSWMIPPVRIRIRRVRRKKKKLNRAVRKKKKAKTDQARMDRLLQEKQNRSKRRRKSVQKLESLLINLILRTRRLQENLLKTVSLKERKHLQKKKKVLLLSWQSKNHHCPDKNNQHVKAQFCVDKRKTKEENSEAVVQNQSIWTSSSIIMKD